MTMLPDRTHARSRGVPWVGYWLIMGLAYHVIYFGVPWPLRLGTWLHVLFWPVYVVIGMLRWIFFPFAMVALVGFLAVFAFNARRRG